MIDVWLRIGLISKLIRGSNIRQISVILALFLENKQKLYFACFVLVHPAAPQVTSQSHIHADRLITSSGPGDTGDFRYITAGVCVLWQICSDSPPPVHDRQHTGLMRGYNRADRKVMKGPVSPDTSAVPPDAGAGVDPPE